MLRKWLIGVACAAVAALLFAPSALAGGGGLSVVFESAPAHIVVNQPTTINFHVVSECSGEAMSGLAPSVTAINLITGRQFTVLAFAQNGAGNYQTVIAFPTQGPWFWQVTSDAHVEQSAPVRIVFAGSALETAASPSRNRASWPHSGHLGSSAYPDLLAGE